MILRGAYNLLTPNSDRYKMSQNTAANMVEWKSESGSI